jgi:hypothetical protein
MVGARLSVSDRERIKRGLEVAKIKGDKSSSLIPHYPIE